VLLCTGYCVLGPMEAVVNRLMCLGEQWRTDMKMIVRLFDQGQAAVKRVMCLWDQWRALVNRVKRLV